ncbi:MAG: hypothetical protein QGG02_07960 [Gammaproteobacteria bacterium]|jgi:hypothetical protein|nr:hypothetical protein [Gammaproteobacteria bacterium]MDP6732282.1 hypothetical protein [Gammaproteobacteria bacterium]|tara:strand:+ start:2041 stop:2394 length:354 start_codon:yes stop_codon:yes gene_type:complete
MEADSNYWLVWVIYLAASVLFYGLFWQLTRFRHARWTAYSLRAIAAAIILTPWYANAQGTTLAPALMVLALDAITIGSEATLRSIIPLVLAIILAETLATVIFLIKKRQEKHAKTNN